MKILKYLLALTLLINFSCDSDNDNNFPPNNNCLNGQGIIVTETRVISDFNSISSTINADILLTQGPKEDIIIEAQQNILDEIETTVVNGELIIRLNRCVDIQQSVKIHVTIPDIQKLTLTGVGDVIAQNNFDLTSLNITLTGAGNFNLLGTVTTLDILLTGAGDVSAFDLISDVCNITISGVGNVEVFVNNELNATITGVGIVYYKGSPSSVNSNITGSGSIVDSN